MKRSSKFLSSLATGAAAFFPIAAFAQGEDPYNRAKEIVGSVQKTATGSDKTQSLESIVGNIINVALGFIGILLISYMVYAGFLWMTAGGDTKKVDTAQTIIKQCIIGLLITVAAFSISNFVLQSVINVAG